MPEIIINKPCFKSENKEDNALDKIAYETAATLVSFCRLDFEWTPQDNMFMISDNEIILELLVTGINNRILSMSDIGWLLFQIKREQGEEPKHDLFKSVVDNNSKCGYEGLTAELLSASSARIRMVYEFNNPTLEGTVKDLIDKVEMLLTIIVINGTINHEFSKALKYIKEARVKFEQIISLTDEDDKDRQH